jgi:hypothetical protein
MIRPENRNILWGKCADMCTAMGIPVITRTVSLHIPQVRPRSSDVPQNWEEEGLCCMKEWHSVCLGYKTSSVNRNEEEDKRKEVHLN